MTILYFGDRHDGDHHTHAKGKFVYNIYSMYKSQSGLMCKKY